MAVAGVSPGDPDTIRTAAESGQNEFWAHATGAGDPDNPDIGGILKAAYACQVGRTIAAPMAQESRNLWLPVIHALLLTIRSIPLNNQMSSVHLG